MSRPTSAAERPGTGGRVWSARSARSGHDNEALDRDQDPPAAMEAEEYVDGRVVVNNTYEDPDLDEPHGCWHQFKKGVRSFWATRHTEDTKQDRDLYIKTTLRELVIYLIFLIVLMILTFCMTSGTMYYYTKVMTELFKDGKFADGKGSFGAASSLADFWRFAQVPLMSGLFWDTWYNNRNVSENMKNFIFYENKLLGVPRIRQVKVRADSCTIAPNFQKDIKQCYAPYSDAVADKAPFGPMNSTAWNYSDASSTEAQSYQGVISSYGGGGFYMDLTRDKASSLAKVNSLFNNLWLTRGTRAVFVDFTVYNANINLFCVVKLILEFPATGGAIPSLSFRTVKLLRYVRPLDFFVLACEVIFILFIFYYSVEEAIEIRKHKCSYFKSVWNWLDIIVIVISLICAAFNIYRTASVGSKLRSLLKNEHKYPDFDFLSYWQQHFNSAVAITVFLAWIKIFKYISFNKTMTQLSSTLGRCAKDLAGFSVMFFIIFFAFAQLGYLLFGTQVKDFREFHHAIFTLFRIILGDFDFHQLESANKVLGPLFFILYVFFVFFILINMFLAIINDTYSEVKSDLANQKNEFEMTDYFKQRANKMFDKLNLKRDKIVNIQKAIAAADINDDKKLDFDEWRNELKNRGYADGEIEAVFAKYDLDGDRILDEDEQRRMHTELEGQKMALSEQIADSERAIGATAAGDSEADESEGGARARVVGGVSIEEFSVLSRRVDRMEHSIGSIVSKIDAVLIKLEAMEKAKVKRREAMGRLLDSITGNEEMPEEQRREQMERLVREELERWDQDGSGSGSPPGGRGLRQRSRPGSSQPDSDRTSMTH